MNETIKKRLGLHIRVQSSIIQLLEKAQELDLSFFQCFFVRQETGSLVGVSAQEVRNFLYLRRAHFNDLVCHGSYWINLASLQNNGYYSLEREINLAKRLEFTHFLLHPGVAKGATDKSQGIDSLALCLNVLMKKERDITFVLENTAHGKLTIGSDILDLQRLLEKIDQPERVRFCIDTAHAHSYGYPIIDEHDQNLFIAFLDETIGIERIEYLHLNDSYEKVGSRIDRHAVIGQGTIGQAALQRFAMHPQLCTIPFILELPEISLEQERSVIEKVCSWE